MDSKDGLDIGNVPLQHGRPANPSVGETSDLVYSIQALKPRVLLVLRFQPDHSSRLREHAGKEYPNSGVRIKEKQHESGKQGLKTYGCRHGN